MTGTSREQAVPVKLIDNERTIVTEWRFADGAETGWHRHEHDYVVLPMADGTLQLESAEGTHYAELKKGEPYFKQAGVEHNVINASGGDFSFIEVEYR
ncbi:cupin domain-containing protein [Fodinicurvata halophila]|uniref:Cupin domain-containing protein n=1 Tax=Fodinicurvata halophila TaxID=1419723 RepID=A0ABV8UI20_9PROT